MKERSIRLRAHEVRGILEGRQTQVRRIAKNVIEDPTFRAGWKAVHLDKRGGTSIDAPTGMLDKTCPFGRTGDRLWVRETFADEAGGTQQFPGPHIYYRADGEGVDLQGGPWTPSIHMPRWASRITLEIIGVRVERLQDISEEDAQAEGVEPLHGGYWRHYQPGWTQHQLSARGSFATLWKSINGPDSWNENPWVWVVEFKNVSGGSNR